MTFCTIRLPGLVFLLAASGLPAAEPWRVLPDGERPADARLQEPRHLRDEYHPWTPPATREEWERTSQRIREQVLVATGLWPLPERTPLEPVVHGTIDRGDYTVSKVYFAGRPGLYVTGNLYRPKDAAAPLPGVLCPHGHWANGRFHDAGPDEAARQLATGAEDYLSGARFPLQARMVQLTRMGCVVFHYDMIGYADSRSLEHRAGFNDADAELWMHNKLGLQTWNSIRALDFLESLPEVDADRIGVTGASGGGTQTFLLGAVDPRPDVAFPAVMVSTGMQGGCVCENASYLRIGLNNIALAALFAPKPLAMSGADDWTIRIETHGLPELRQVYSLHDAAPLVTAETWARFPHNYNQHAREMMYNWFNEHLVLGIPGPVEQSDFWPIMPEELSVFDEEHPRPDDELDAPALRAALRQEDREWFAELVPKTADDLPGYREIIGTAARVMLDRGVPPEEEIDFEHVAEQPLGRYTVTKALCGRTGGGERIPLVILSPPQPNGTMVLWFDDAGKRTLFGDDGEPVPAVARLLDAGAAVASADLFGTGEFLTDHGGFRTEVNETYPGYTFGYNRPLLSQRVRDILTVIAVVRSRPGIEQVHLVGVGAAGPWVLLARGLAGDSVARTLADRNGFSFHDVTAHDDPMLLPGALKYGGLGGLAALAAPHSIIVYGADEEQLAPLNAVYDAARGDVQSHESPLTPEAVADQFTSADSRR